MRCMSHEEDPDPVPPPDVGGLSIGSGVTVCLWLFRLIGFGFFPYVEWGLSHYNTKISFSDVVYCSQVAYDAFNNSWWYWYKVKTFGSELLSTIGLSVQNANLTVLSLGENAFNTPIIKFTVTAGTGVESITRIYCGSLGKPTSVTGTSSWSYDDGSKVVTIRVVHHSPETVTVKLAYISRKVSNLSLYSTIGSMLGLTCVVLAAVLIIRTMQEEMGPGVAAFAVFFILTAVLAGVVLPVIMNALPV